jgi:flagellar biosynthetic protein FliQ
MRPDTVLEIGREALWLAVMLATQIQEMTLSFIPKLGAVAAVIFLVGPWMLRLIVTFTQRLFLEIPGLVG